MKKIVLAILLISPITLFSQQKPQDLIDNFFTTYKTDPGKAVRELYKTNSWTERVRDDIENVVTKINGFTVDYIGKYYGYELITTKKFAQSYVLYSYLVKYDRQPLRFIFKFYKPNDKWILYGFQYDDNFNKEIEEAAKLYYLDLNNDTQ